MNLMTSSKAAIQRVMRSFGWEIRRFYLSEMDQLVHFLEQHGVDVVLDVGANIGQFALTLRQAGYAGTIISFEPQSRAHDVLTRAASSDPKWLIAPRCAVGAEAGEIEMNISHNSVSSSILDILPAHTEGAPGSRYISKEKVRVIRLDDCDLVPMSGNIYLKVDTQGFEQFVLDGAPGLLTRLKGLQLEMSLVPLYAGQASFLALMTQLLAMGYDLWSITPEFQDQKTSRLLQANGIFFRRA